MVSNLASGRQHWGIVSIREGDLEVRAGVRNLVGEQKQPLLY